jgi:hypothetical protein
MSLSVLHTELLFWFLKDWKTGFLQRIIDFQGSNQAGSMRAGHSLLQKRRLDIYD